MLKKLTEEQFNLVSKETQEMAERQHRARGIIWSGTNTPLKTKMHRK